MATSGYMHFEPNCLCVAGENKGVEWLCVNDGLGNSITMFLTLDAAEKLAHAVNVFIYEHHERKRKAVDAPTVPLQVDETVRPEGEPLTAQQINGL